VVNYDSDSQLLYMGNLTSLSSLCKGHIY